MWLFFSVTQDRFDMIYVHVWDINIYVLKLQWLVKTYIPQIKFLATPLIIANALAVLSIVQRGTSAAVCAGVQSHVSDNPRQFSWSFRLDVALHGPDGRRAGRREALPLRLSSFVVGGGRQGRPGDARSSLRPPGLTVRRAVVRRRNVRPAARQAAVVVVREAQVDEQRARQRRSCERVLSASSRAVHVTYSPERLLRNFHWVT